MSSAYEKNDEETGASPNNNTVTERIDFNKTHEINRALPTLLSDNGKMTVMVWEQFCDKIDDALKPLGRIKAITSVFWAIVIVGVVIMASAQSWISQETINFVWGIMGPVTFVCLFLICKVESHVKNKVTSKVTNICASTSNHDRDLTMALNSNSDEVKHWFIEVRLRNIHVDDDMFLSGKPIDEQIPVAVATPVANNALAGSPVPKKYVRDNNGNLTLNPEYKEWKAANPGVGGY